LVGDPGTASNQRRAEQQRGLGRFVPPGLILLTLAECSVSLAKTLLTEATGRTLYPLRAGGAYDTPTTAISFKV
jgi:hypothetical protein